MSPLKTTCLNYEHPFVANTVSFALVVTMLHFSSPQMQRSEWHDLSPKEHILTRCFKVLCDESFFQNYSCEVFLWNKSWYFSRVLSPTAECYGVFAQYRFRGELGRFRERTRLTGSRVQFPEPGPCFDGFGRVRFCSQGLDGTRSGNRVPGTRRRFQVPEIPFPGFRRRFPRFRKLLCTSKVYFCTLKV